MENATVESLRLQQADLPASEEDLVSVLFIADDTDLAEMYRLKLETDGYRVTIVGPGEATVKPVRRNLPDLIYLDIRMPHRDRVDVLKSLRVNRSTRRIPVVILSDYQPQELAEAGARFGVGEYVISSSTKPTLSASIKEWSHRQAEWD